jgi:hypothetical protein
MSLDRQSSWVLVALAAVAAAFVAVQPRPSSSPAKADTVKHAAAKAASGGAEGDPGGPLKPFWDAFPPPGPPQPRWPVDYDNWPEHLKAEGAVPFTFLTPRGPVGWRLPGIELRFLIATVPDPATSGFGQYFDHTVEAIQRALETQGYVIDRAWMPWPQPGAPAPAGRPYEKQPGLVLFRHIAGLGDGPSDDPARARRFLVLFLVGESATAGIHPVAFDTCVRLIRDCPENLRGERVLRVLGPNFTGSQTSLARALGRARAQPGLGPWPFKVVCGGATSINCTAFCSYWHQRGRDLFRTTIVPDSLVRHWVYKYLANPSDPTDPNGKSHPPNLVVLQEANTTFGQVAYDRDRKARQAQPDGQGQPAPAEEDQRDRVATIPFPLHISRLRASYTKAQLAQLEALGLPRPAWDIPMPAGDEEGRADEPVPSQAPWMTTTVNNLIVTNLVQAMAQKRARYVALVASDTRDKIFLANLIRDRFPDVQLCSTEGDLLYTHPDQRYALWGMVVGSTYPLHPGVQSWGDTTRDPEKHRILFAHQAFQGCYNATLALLADVVREAEADRAMLDYGGDVAGKDDKGQKFTTPGIWISAVSQNGQMIPLSYVTPRQIADDLKAREAAGEKLDDQKWQYGDLYQKKLPSDNPPAFPRATCALPNLSSLLFTALSLAVAVFLYRAYAWVQRSRWDETFAGQLAASKQRIDYTIAGVAMIVLYAWIARLAVIPWLYAGEEADFWPRLAALLASLSSVTFIGVIEVSILLAFLPVRDDGTRELWRDRLHRYWSLLKLSGRPGQEAGRWLPRAAFLMVLLEGLVFLASFALAVWGIAYALVRLFFSPARPAPQELLDFARMTTPGTGLSPLIPVVFLCAALFAWGIFLVKKLYLASRFSVPSPFPTSGPKAFRDLNRLDQDIRNELMPPSTWQHHPGLCLLMLFLLLLVFLKILHSMTPPLDGMAFGVLTWAGFLLGSYLLVFTLCQVYLAWGKLRKLLRALALLPMVGAYGRLPEKVVSIFGRYLSSHRPRHSHLALAVHQFGLLRASVAELRGPLYQAAQNVPEGQADSLTQAVKEFDAAFPPGGENPVPALFEAELDSAQEPDYETPEDRPNAGDYLNGAARSCLTLLWHFWPFHTMDEAFGGPLKEPPEHAEKPAAPAVAFPVREWAVRAEDFVATQVVRYLSQFFVQLRNLLTSLSVGALLLLLTAVAYPFHPQSLLLTVLTTLCGAVAVFIVVFLIQVNRNELLSRINRTTPDRFTPDLGFLQGATTYVLPIIGGLMVQFPFFASGLRSLFEPLMHVIR